MKINKAYKFRLYPNKEQEKQLCQNFGLVRFIWNKMLGERIEAYNNYKDDKEELYAIKYKTEKQWKEEFEFLKEADATSLQQSRIDLEIAFKNFYKKGKKSGYKLRESVMKRLKKKSLKRNLRNTDLENHPQFKRRKDKQSYRTYNTKIDFETKHIKLPKIDWIKYSDNRTFNEKEIKSMTISKTPTGKYYASILIETELYIEDYVPNKNSKVIGLDYSSKELFVDNEGNTSNYPKYYRQYESQLKRQQRKLKNKEKFSNSWNKQQIKISKIHEKISNCRKDFLHKLSNQITNDYDIIGVEDISMKSISQLLNLGKSTLDNGFGMFRSMLEYKCLWKGKHLIYALKRYASSKTCNACGWKNTELKLSDREWTCPQCGVEHNRDINAGKNLKNYALEVLGLERPVEPVDYPLVDERELAHLKSYDRMNQESSPFRER